MNMPMMAQYDHLVRSTTWDVFIWQDPTRFLGLGVVDQWWEEMAF
jgi:hypothetical protein